MRGRRGNGQGSLRMYICRELVDILCVTVGSRLSMLLENRRPCESDDIRVRQPILEFLRQASG